MWFDEDKLSGRRKKRRKKRKSGNRRAVVLGVNTRMSVQRGQSSQRTVVIVFTLLAVGLAIALIGAGIVFTSRIMFSRNDRFIIRNLEIRTEPGAVITPSLIREYVDISEGMNLFEVNIGAIRRDFLRRAPNVKSMEITRILPHTLRIEIVERSPIAHIKQRRASDVHVDELGFVFAPRSKKSDIAIISGYTGPKLEPGDQVRGILRDAVVLLSTSHNTPAGKVLEVKELNVRGGYEGRQNALRIHLAGKTTVDFWWVRRRQKDMRGSNDLRERTLFLGGMVRRARTDGRSLRTVNLTLDAYKNNCPVTYW